MSQKKGQSILDARSVNHIKKQETDEYGNPKDLDDDISNIFND